MGKKKKIYRNAKNEKKLTEKNEDGVISSGKWEVVALFYPKKHNTFYDVIFTRTKIEQKNSLKIWYNMLIPPWSLHDHAIFMLYCKYYNTISPLLNGQLLIKYTKNYCVIK